jgi:signal transduction histidine kinase
MLTLPLAFWACCNRSSDMNRTASENRRILVIDDSLAIHEDFQKILMPAGSPNLLAGARASLFSDVSPSPRTESFDVDFADQGEVGFRLVEKALGAEIPYALAFVDMRMPPGWDGIETVQRLWQVDPELEIVICTAYSDYSWEEVATTLPQCDKFLILRKPFDAIEVFQLATSLTRKWNLAQQAEERLKAAEVASLAKSQFIANMSHEIRTPMNGILGMSELLLQTPLSDRQRQLAKTVHSSGTELLQIINDILDFSKIEAGKFRMERIRFDLFETVKDVVDHFSDLTHDKSIELAFEVSDSIPPVFLGDPLRLRQVLMNLISNAVKFTDRGKVMVTVAMEQDSLSDAALRFEVQDTGIGIEETAQAKIFEAFTQVDDSTTRKYGGSGLGLAIVKQLVHHMEGTVGVRSVLGEGATFWFTARLAKVLGKTREDVQNRGERWEDGPAGASPQIPDKKLDGTRILLVEDNPVNREVASEMLQIMGCDVNAVEQGQEAVKAVRARQYDLVLMDCQMPVMDGFAASRAIRVAERGDSRHVPIVALTASAMEGDRERCLEAGMDDYLGKPFTLATLQDIVCRWVPRKAA